MLAIEVLKKTEMMNEANKSTNTSNISDVQNSARLYGDNMNNLADANPQELSKNSQDKKPRKKKLGLSLSLKIHKFQKQMKDIGFFVLHLAILYGVKEFGKNYFR